MRIGELAREVDVSPDTVRFYERSGLLPRPRRRDNAYRDYTASDVDHLRLLIDLRRLDIPLDQAARVASWCHSGHCSETVSHLPSVISMHRNEVRERIGRLQELDQRLAGLERHLGQPNRGLSVLNEGTPCCDAATAVLASAEGGCACCAVAAD